MRFILPFGDIVFKGNFIKSLRFWRKFKDFSQKDLEDYQKKALKKKLQFANENIIKYKDILLSDNDTIEEMLLKFPILTKTDLKVNPNILISNSKEKSTKISSSGSTGESTTVFMNIKDLTSLQALQFHLWELCGYKIGMPVLQTGISPKRSLLKKLKDIFFGTMYISAFSLTEKQLQTICKKLNKNKLYTIIGYPSSVNIIASYILENDLDLSIARFIGIGDAMLSKYKLNIKKALKCEIYEMYGTSEGFQIGFQYDLKYMYQYSPQVYLELLDDNDNEVKDGEIGNVVVTRLDNYNMPLIRYKIGDLAIKLPKEHYPKKRKYNFPLLEKVVGRNTDIVILPDNRKMVVHSFTGIFEYIVEIKQFKIIQKDKSGILIEYIPADNFENNILANIKRKLQKHIANEEFYIEFIEVTSIKSAVSGKTQLIKSYLTL